MTDTSTDPTTHAREGDWATPVDRLSVGAISPDAMNLNVQGKRITSPLQGFGQLWQKTYKIPLTGANVTPQEVIEVWKAHFPEFWPQGNRFYGGQGPIHAGDVAVLNLASPVPGAGISTGVLVIYSDDISFSFLTPQGHMFAGMNTFSSTVENGVTVAQNQVLVRASDPVFELGCRLGVVHKGEDAFWKGTLTNLAARFGVQGQAVEQKNVLVDNKVQWSEAGNIWHNAAIRTTLYMPVYWAKRALGK